MDQTVAEIFPPHLYNMTLELVSHYVCRKGVLIWSWWFVVQSHCRFSFIEEVKWSVEVIFVTFLSRKLPYLYR